MKSFSVSLRIICWVVVSFLPGSSRADTPQNGQEETATPWNLKEGDRVVLLGGTMIEREQRYGGWEMILTVTHPKTQFTVRNLGWSGDTVWAESRGIFDPPAKGYQRMLEQVRSLKPTVIMLGYGANESFAGQAGLDAFLKQYNKLLDDLDELKPRWVFLAPPAREETAFDVVNMEEHQSNLKLYRDAIQELAKERDGFFIDLFQSLEERNATTRKLADLNLKPLSENGLHWNSHGYDYTALYLCRAFSWSLPHWNLTITVNGDHPTNAGVKVTNLKTSPSGVEFTAQSASLPLSSDYSQTLIVAGLEPGSYQLKIDGNVIAKADKQGWADGVLISQGPDFAQSKKLRQTIRNKNRLYFHRWRPQNVTYLFGFRKHEQGQNAKEVPLFDPLVSEKEQEIHRLKQPHPHRYVLKRVESR